MGDRPMFPVKKAFLYALIGSVAVSALFGIGAILSGHWGLVENRILLTSTTIAGASICGLACGAYLGTQRRRALPLAGIGLTILGAVTVIIGIWQNSFSPSLWRLAATSSVYAVACAHLSLLSMARLADWFRWSLVAAYVAILGVATIIAVLILGEAQGDTMFRFLGVAAIFDAAISILIPVFHRLSKADFAAEAEPDPRLSEIDSEILQLRRRLEELEQIKRQG